jgi:N-acetylmuramoyl-L-alanine amidase
MMVAGRAAMKRRECICVLGSIASGFWPRRTIIVAIATMVLLPIEASHAGWLSDLFKGSKQSKSSRQAKPAKHVRVSRPAVAAKRAVSPKRNAVKLAALGPVHLSPAALKPAATRCDPAKFRIVLDVGHTAESEGAISARNISEFVYNLRLAKRIEEKLKAEGFRETRLLLTEGKEMKAQGFDYAKQYSQAIMGRYQRELLNKETGVYRYDELIVLRKTRMAAVLLEAGSIINRDEELKMSSPERRDIISSSVAAAVKEFCEPRWAMLGPL